MKIKWLFLLHLLSTGEIKLDMPTINLDAEVDELAANAEVVEKLEHCAMTWLTLISTAVEEQLKKVPQVTRLITSEYYRRQFSSVLKLFPKTSLHSVLISQHN